MSIKSTLSLVAALLCGRASSFQVPAKTAFALPDVTFTFQRGRSLYAFANDEPNPPTWPDSVKILTPSMSTKDIMDIVGPTQDGVEDKPHVQADTRDEKKGEVVFNAKRHFVNDRFALLFAPGTYTNVDVQVGYYVQLAGLGAKAEDVLFTNCEFGPYCPALRKSEWIPNNVTGRPGLSLDTFWRVAENYKTNAKQGQLWAVSQAAPIRRVHSMGNFLLHDEGAQASGGHMANCLVDGTLKFGSQQQFCCRSVNITDGHDFGAWSNVFVDCPGGPKQTVLQEVYAEWGSRTVTVTVDNPQVTVEKPFVAMKEMKKDGEMTFELRVPTPRLRKKGEGPLGADLFGTDDDVRDFGKVFVARADDSTDKTTGKSDNAVANKINKALEDGKDIVLSPGVYYLSEPIKISKPNQVVLGLGLATLVAPVDGRPCLQVAANIEGVRVAGIMLEASVIDPKKKGDKVASFIEFGEEGTPDTGNPNNPGVLTDIFARVGGSNLNRTVSTDVMIRIHSGNVYGDNLWLWRADHVQLADGEDPNVKELDYHQTTLGEVPVETGLIVAGNNVTIHGLAVEHTTRDQVIWNGKGGNVQFYQCELPYDVNADFATSGYRGYRVNALDHKVGGAGVYSNFRDHAVPVETAISHPESDEIEFIHPFTVLLNNKGTIMSVINGKGEPATEKGRAMRVD